MIDGRRYLGVLDCSAPPAGAAFMERLAAAGRRASGPVPAVLWSDPVAVEDEGASQVPAPAPVLLALHTLERIGVDAIVLPGAAAHAWYRDLCAAAHVPVMHIVECAAADLRRARPPGSRVAVLAAAEAGAACRYRARLRRLAFDVMETPAHVADHMAEAGTLALRGENAAAVSLVQECIDAVAAAGARAAVLACGEVLCAVHANWSDLAASRHGGRRPPRDPIVIDPLGSLARTAASWSRGGCDAWDLVVDIPAEQPESAAAPPA